jgi:DNA-binding CsgD family transcriptional regulator
MKLHATLKQQGPLTQKESDVLLLICEGKMRKEICRVCHRSYGCVSKQIEAIAEKLGAHSAAEIVAKAVANHYVDITIKIWLLAMLCQCCLMDDDSRRPPKAARSNVTRCHTRQQTPRFQRES